MFKIGFNFITEETGKMIKLDKQTKKYSFVLADCHHSLNQYGQLALKTKEIPISSVYHLQISSSSTSLPKQTSKEQEKALSKMLLQSNDWQSSKKLNPELEEQFKALKELGLENPRQLKRIAYEGSIKIPTVHNDYHSRASNHGYSRSPLGGIYPK